VKYFYFVIYQQKTFFIPTFIYDQELHFLFIK